MTRAKHAANPVAMWAGLRDNWELVSQLTRREIVGRYRGSVLGLLWAVAHPLLLLGVYTFVFRIVLKARWGAEAGSDASFALILFAGLVTFNIFAECVSRAPTLVLANPSYVKRIVFPLEILPFVIMGSALFQAVLGFAILLVAIPAIAGELHWTLLWLPVTLLPLVCGILGLTWFLAALGVYLRDLGQIVTIVVTVLMFTTPIFYPLEVVPEELRWVFAANPLAVAVEQVRTVVLWNGAPDWAQLGIQLAAGLVVMVGGFWWFQRSRKGFADVV